MSQNESSVSSQKQCSMIVEGYFYPTPAKASEYPDISSSLVLPRTFIRSAQRFEKENLHVLHPLMIRRLYRLGGEDVFGVVDLKGSVLPFFVTKTELSKIK